MIFPSLKVNLTFLKKLNEVLEDAVFWIAISNLEWTVSGGLKKTEHYQQRINDRENS